MKRDIGREYDLHDKILECDRLKEQNKIMRDALERLTKVGPPSKSCTGEEHAIVCLKDNCEIAKQALVSLTPTNEVKE